MFLKTLKMAIAQKLQLTSEFQENLVGDPGIRDVNLTFDFCFLFCFVFLCFVFFFVSDFLRFFERKLNLMAFS